MVLCRVLPDEYPLRDSVRHYLSNEQGFGRLVDFGMIVPRLPQLHQWSAEDRGVWQPPRSLVLQLAQWFIPAG